MRPLRYLVAFVLFVVTGLVVAQDYPARVVTYAEHQGGNVVYRYEIRNSGPAEIKHFYVGCDCRLAPRAMPQLRVLPVDGRSNRSDDSGTWYELPAAGVAAPSGWRVRAFKPRGAIGHWIEWYMPSAHSNSGIAAGQTLGGFAVTLPGSDESYLSANFTVIPEGNRAGVSGSLALLDTAPPSLTFETKTASVQSGVTAAVRVVAIAKDDRDPEPAVVAESIEREEGPNGRNYVMVYSATDASGNRATARTRVLIPATQAPTTEDTSTPPLKPVNLPRLAFLP